MTIFITRKKHDELLKKNVTEDKKLYFVNAISYMKKYKHTYNINGITYYNVDEIDRNILD